MTTPIRWSESKGQVDPVVRALLRYAQDIQPGAERMERLAAQVAAVAGPSAGAVASSTWVKLVASKAAWFLSGATLVGAGSLAYPRVAEHNAAAVGSAAPLAPLSERAWDQAPIHTGRVGLLARDLHSSQPHQRALNSVGSRPEPSEPANEVELLQLGRSLLASEPHRALTITLQHARRFPESSLVQEREAMAIEALFLLGRIAEGQAKLESFRASYPGSLHLRRLQAYERAAEAEK